MPTRVHRVAIARIFSDLIKADRIIDTGEMECWERICAKYHIDKGIETEAQGVSFSYALDAICNSGEPGLREDLLGDCRSMTVSDGFCAHSEALLMITLMLMLETDQDFSVETFSIPKASFNVDVATALYVESESDPDINEAIRDCYRTLYKEFQLAGFHFVYPPKIIEHYRETDPHLFRQILSFLAPSMSREKIEEAYDSLMEMTTDVFCKDLLCNKCGITDLRNTYPSLLIKIGNSFVGDVAYANYLKIEVGTDILATVQEFLDRFSDMLSGDMFVISTSEEKDSQFHFHGFYKQLLDIYLSRRNVKSKVVINLKDEQIDFEDIDTKASGLHRRERALYALLLCAGPEGLNFKKPATASALAKYNKRMERIQSQYTAIYSCFNGGSERVPDLTNPTIRRPIVATLRRSHNALSGLLYNPADYNVTSSNEGVISVNVDPKLIYVRQREDIPLVPLKDSDLYRKYLNVG